MDYPYTQADQTPSQDAAANEAGAAAEERAAYPTPAETESALALALVEVSNLRTRIDEESKFMADLIKAVKESDDFKSAEMRRAVRAVSLAEAEAKVKNLALEAFKATGVKSRVGVTIKRFTSTTVKYDYNTAFEWAQKRAPELIVLDQRLFEDYVKLVRKSIPVPCAQIVETYEDRAQIDTDLLKCRGPLAAAKK